MTDTPSSARDAPELSADAPVILPATRGISGVEPAERSALTDVGSHLRFWLVAVLGLVLDLWSKDFAFRTLLPQKKFVLIPHVIEFQWMLNPGALFGIGAGMTTLFLVASLLALLLVFWMFAHSAPRRWMLQIALGGILAGAMGNMYDRVFVKLVQYPSSGPFRYWVKSTAEDGDTVVLTEFGPQGTPRTRRLTGEAAASVGEPVGYVRDFIKIPTTVGGREIWPWVFNVADMLLVGGVSILAIGLWTERNPRPAAAAGTAPAAVNDGDGG